MTATKESFIAGLNKALEWEYAAAIQYVQHAALITGPEYDAIAKEFVVHSNEEMGHAVVLSEIITDLDGVPTVDVEQRDVSEGSVDMLKQDLKGEELAIKIYKNLIKMAEELNEYGIRRKLEDIFMDEEEHRRDILSFLGR